jgi:glycosyltransferase involved in cell wall biosynthesis
MGVGLPTIVFSDGGGLVEHVDQGETGYVVSSAAELRAAVLRLLEDSDERARVGMRGRRTVRERYTPAAAADRYRDLYAHALSKPVRRHRRSPTAHGS